MRHVRSIFYALVLAPAAWVLTGVGLNRDLSTRGRDGFAVETFAGLLLLLLAGAAYGILVLGPVSPAGPLLAGLAFLGISVWALVSPATYAAVWPPLVAKEGFDLSRPGYGLAALLAVPLICTALSGRRWEKYEPPVLPIIGQIGRARGAAAVAGTPIAAVQTTVITAPSGYRQAGFAPDDRTTVLRLPADTTTILVPGDEETTVVTGGEMDKLADLLAGASPAGASPAGASPVRPSPVEEPTARVGLGPDEEPTVSVLRDGVDPTTSQEVTESSGRPDVGSMEPDVGSMEESGEPLTVPVSGIAAAESDEEAPADVVAAESDEEAPADVVAAESDEEAPADVVAAESGEEAPADVVAAEPGAGEGESAAPNTQVVRLPLPNTDERTQVVRLPVGDLPERTQVLRLPVGDAPDRTEVVRLPVGDAGDRTEVVRLPVGDAGDRTEVVRLPVGDAGDRTEVVRLPVGDAADRTRVVRLPVGGGTEIVRLPLGDAAARARAAKAPTDEDETTRVLQFPAPKVNDGTTQVIIPEVLSGELPRGDVGDGETQVIRLPGAASVDDERTRVIRPGLVAPAGERTEVLRFPARATGDEDPGDKAPGGLEIPSQRRPPDES